MTTYRASRKEPLADLLGRVHEAFVSAGIDPTVEFIMSDPPGGEGVSSVARVIKRYPELESFLQQGTTEFGVQSGRSLSNLPGAPAAGRPLDYSTLLEIAGGVPRSFPFARISVGLTAPEFGGPFAQLPGLPPSSPGLVVSDSWWVNGRRRALQATVLMDADPGNALEPRPTGPAGAVLAALGKPKSTRQVALPDDPEAGGDVGSDPQHAVEALRRDYVERMDRVVAEAGPPHELPSLQDALTSAAGTGGSGPKKPALVTAFKPLGYDCKGGSGTFTLQRRTSANTTVRLSLDVGTWSNMLTTFYEVEGLHFGARLPVPPGNGLPGPAQYPIGDRWERIVENLAAIAAHLDRTLVPAIEDVAGPTPDWYRPTS